MMLPAFVLFLGSSILFIVVFSKYKHNYWKRLSIPYVRPFPLLGNLKDLLFTQISFGELFQQLHADEAVRHAPLGGIFVLHQPALILRDPDLIKLVLIKHFDKFLNRYEAADSEHDVMGALTLPLSKYPIWRDCRKKCLEVFTSGKIKQRMYPLMLKITTELEQSLDRKISISINAQGNKEVVLEVKEICSLYTTDLTSVLHYGKDVGGLKNGHSSLRQQALQLFDVSLVRICHFFIIFFLPHLTGLLRAKVFSKSYMTFMRNLTNLIYQERGETTSSDYQGDLMDILQKFQTENVNKQHYTQHMDFIPSQVAIFLLAGFETSSSVLGFILYELAKQPELQAHLKKELKKAFGAHESLTYDSLQSISYLHQVVCEGLRMYPAAAFINRECTAEAVQLKGFQLTSDVFIPNGMPVYVSILGLHRDAKYWPEPNNFMPERFIPSAVEKMHPMTYLPFGAGPHGCIGSRLGHLQVKLGLAHILRRFSVAKCPQTVREIKFDPKSFMLQAKDGIYLKFIKDL